MSPFWAHQLGACCLRRTLLARKHRGYPQAHEDDAPRALRAALDIAEAVDQLELSITLPFDALAVRIGIATGTVVVGNIGSGARREEMAVVDETPNLAARLQAQASPGEIIIAAQTFRLVADYFDIDDLGEYKLKGISQPQTAYRVRGESGAQGRLDASASLGLTPLVALLSLDKDAKLPGVLQSEELKRRQHAGTVEQWNSIVAKNLITTTV